MFNNIEMKEKRLKRKINDKTTFKLFNYFLTLNIFVF